MTAFLLLVWWVAGSGPDLGRPWSGWFVALFVCALLDFFSLGGSRID